MALRELEFGLDGEFGADGWKLHDHRSVEMTPMTPQQFKQLLVRLDCLRDAVLANVKHADSSKFAASCDRLCEKVDADASRLNEDSAK